MQTAVLGMVMPQRLRLLWQPVERTGSKK